jgi:hypothetical protein
MRTTKLHARGGAPTVELEQARRRFERWRETRLGRSRIPEALWPIAVGLARQHGLNQTARALRLNYYGLKRRVESGGGKVEEGRTTFVELIAPKAATGTCECILEMENARGAKMRIQLKGGEAPELARLASVLSQSRCVPG